MKYLMTNEELQDGIIQTDAMIKSYLSKDMAVPAHLRVHILDLLEIQKTRASTALYEKDE